MLKTDVELTCGGPLSDAERQLLARVTNAILPMSTDVARERLAVIGKEVIDMNGGFEPTCPHDVMDCRKHWFKAEVEASLVALYCRRCGAGTITSKAPPRPMPPSGSEP